MVILSRLYQPRRKLVKVSVDRIAILAHQDYFIPFFSIKAVNNYTVRLLLLSDQFQILRVLRTGSHIITARMTFPILRFQLVQIQMRIFGQLYCLFYSSHKKKPSFLFPLIVLLYHVLAFCQTEIPTRKKKLAKNCKSDYTVCVFEICSSGRGVIPHRRYSPRPA